MSSGVTQLGTPCSPRWTDDWIAVVEHFENRLGRRICGAELPGGVPCEAASHSANGRCALHGGIAHIGAQPGNVNALREGLYSRRLRPCSRACPHWRSCPMASKEVAELEPRKRPACVYEQREYDATLRGVLESMGIECDRRDEDAALDLRFAEAMAIEAAEAYALSKVLAQRAASVLNERAMVDEVEVMELGKTGYATAVSGAAEACLKFQREQRNWHKRVMACGAAVVELRAAFAMDEMKGEEKVEGGEPEREAAEKRETAAAVAPVRKNREKSNGHAPIPFVNAAKPRQTPKLSRDAFMGEVAAMREAPAGEAREAARPRTVLDGPAGEEKHGLTRTDTD